MKAPISLTPQEVADLLRITKNTVYQLIKRGELKGYKVGKKIRIDLSEVEAYKQQGKPSSPSEKPAPLSQIIPASPVEKREPLPEHLVICGQDPLLDVLSRHLEKHPQRVDLLRSYVGSYNGLYNLYYDQVHGTAAHLWDGDTGEYNTPYVRRLLPGMPALIIRLCARVQGFYVAKNNPKHIRTWEDLARSDLSFINREKGSGTRILLDEQLRLLGLPGSRIQGYNRIDLSHLAMASTVASGEADVALGNEITSFQVKAIDFVPLQVEHYDLVIKKEALSQPPFQAMVEIINSAAFKRELSGIGGYDLTDTGRLVAET